MPVALLKWYLTMLTLRSIMIVSTSNSYATMTAAANLIGLIYSQIEDRCSHS